MLTLVSQPLRPIPGQYVKSNCTCWVRTLTLSQSAKNRTLILSSCHSHRSADGTEVLSPLFPLDIFFSLQHRDATGDRIMHFSWGAERKCARCSSSVWAMFCSVNTYSFSSFSFFFSFFYDLTAYSCRGKTSSENNHVSSWDSFSFQQSDVSP